MLILSRRVGERILIGDNAYIIVAGINGNHVKLGLDFPREVNILRSEVQKFEKQPEADDEDIY